MLGRAAFISLAFIFTLAGSSNGDDYILKIRVVGYRNALVVGKKPEAKVMRQLEVPVTVGVPFEERSVDGRRVLSATGRVKQKRGRPNC